MKCMAALLLLVAAMSAQSTLSTNTVRRLDIPAISREAKGAVVSIVVSDKDDHPVAQGSGFLISKDGNVVTNYHVIKDGSSAVVKLPSGALFLVDGVLASDEERDIAIIKAHGNDFRMLTLGDSDKLQVGEEVVAIGSPLSLESTVSNGIVSGKRTLTEEGRGFLQITVPISPGSSGGPLFNMAGEVVGITTSHLTGGENLNFAIPINDLKPLLMARFSKARLLPEALKDEAQTELRKKQQAHKTENEAFLAANKTKEGVVTLPSGLQYKVLKEGTGPKASASDSVVCNYRSYLIDGTEFDSPNSRDQPATLPVGALIKGWTEALQLMPVGAKWQLFVPSALAYGERGAGGLIGPDSTLIFEVELLSIQAK